MLAQAVVSKTRGVVFRSNVYSVALPSTISGTARRGDIVFNATLKWLAALAILT